MSGTALEARGLTKAWGRRLVLDAVDLDLVPGRITAVLGPSGAGKSTLLRALAGLEAIDAGTITSGGRMLSDARTIVPPERRRIGIVFQDGALFPHLTALANVAFGLAGRDRTRAAAAALERVGLAARAGAYPHQLSGGEQSRVAFARALAPSPGVMLLDEPFASLDGALRRTLRESARATLKAAGMAALLVTHDPSEAMAVADELVLMIAGRIVQRGPCEEVFQHPASPSAAHLLGDVNEWPGEARSGLVRTPFGEVAAARQRDGPAIALVRPEGLRVAREPGGTIRVAAHTFLGPLVELVLEAPCGARWRARIPFAEAPASGTIVTVAIEPRFASVVIDDTNMSVISPLPVPKPARETPLHQWTLSPDQALPATGVSISRGPAR